MEVICILSFLKKLKPSFHNKDKVPVTRNVMEDSITLHGEDPGAIPPVDDSNPLVEEKSNK